MIGDRLIAYFSMEVGLEPGMPTYSGGLGVLAGDTIRAAADLKVPMMAITLLHRKGFFYQRLDGNGEQIESSAEWSIDDFLEPMDAKASVTVAGRTVHLRAWRYRVEGTHGFYVPVYFLDADLPENDGQDRQLTDTLYGGDTRYRLCQEIILGIGGVRMLRALGYSRLARFHMNEGHSSLLTLELLEEQLKRDDRTTVTPDDIQAVRQQCVFTTHTPVPAGHDQFPFDLVGSVLHDSLIDQLRDQCCFEDHLNMTYLALNFSHYVNGVAKKHGEVSRLMFANYSIDAITNGIHTVTWTSEPMQHLFDRYIPGWREDSFSLRSALSIPAAEIWEAHRNAKKDLINFVNHETNAGMELDVLTLGFARRATPYKRMDLVLSDIERLQAIAASAGPFQLIFAGKAHPNDQPGKALIKRVVEISRRLKDRIKLVYLPNYDMTLGKLLTAGVDVWLNTPLPPMEASGTSGMKAAANGVPSLSVMDGWWIEGCLEGITGWGIDDISIPKDANVDRSSDAFLLYAKLEWFIIPMYYNNRHSFINIMKQAIAHNASFFNTHRMVLQYVLKAYLT